MQKKDFSRRKFLSKYIAGGTLLVGTLFLPGCTTNPPSSSDGERGNKKQSTSEDPCDDLSGVSEKEIQKRQSLGYLAKSAIPESFCGNCSLYIPAATENGCGGCLLFKGPVHAEGYCMQYAVKV